MKTYSHRLGLTVCVLGAATAAVHAQMEQASLLKNRVSVSARFGFNLSADIHNNVAAPNVAPYYDDGYVAPDVSGNGQTTWNWGYDHNNQISNGSLALHIASGSPRDNTTDSYSDSPKPGFEILYGRELFYVPISAHHTLTIGAQAGFGALDANLHYSGSVSGTVNRTTDLYNLGGIIPPLAPYAGTFSGPGPLLSLKPYSSTTTAIPATSSLDARVRALVYGIKLGPFVDLPLTRRLFVEAAAGVAAVNADTTFSYTETVSFAGTGGLPPAVTGSYSRSEWLIGCYGSAQLGYRLTRNLSAFVGGQYQHLGNVTVPGGSKTATLKLGDDLEAIVGLEATF